MSTVIIVGGSSGIGLALVQRLIANNEIVNISRSPCAVAGVKNITADAGDFAQLAAAFSQITQADALIYCAGRSMAAAVQHVRPEDYVELFKVNTLGAIESVRLAMPMLRAASSGRIILLSSSGGITPIAFDSFYSASKAALNIFSLALDLEHTGVKCTAAVIGGTRTRFSFKRNVYRDCGDYATDLKHATNALMNMEQNGYTADFVARKLQKLLESNAPPPVSVIGFKNKLMMFLYKALPVPVAQKVLKAVYKIK